MRPTEKPRIRRREAGFTLAELVMVASVLTILAMATLPVAKFTAKRSKEADLKSDLREMRMAVGRRLALPQILAAQPDRCRDIAVRALSDHRRAAEKRDFLYLIEEMAPRAPSRSGLVPPAQARSCEVEKVVGRAGLAFAFPSIGVRRQMKGEILGNVQAARSTKIRPVRRSRPG